MNPRTNRALIFGLTLLIGTTYAFSGTCENIVIPAYFYPWQPNSYWNEAVDNAPLPHGRSQILIMNPDNGPGASFDKHYADAVATVHAAGKGFLVFGYIYTGYGKRSRKVVEQAIDKYYSWYDVDGIFVDETASDGSLVETYYQPLADYITRKKSKAGVMLNPGDYPDQAYANISVPHDSLFVINVFEDIYRNYLNATVPSWVYSYPAEMFSHLIYFTHADKMTQVVALSAERHVGWVFVTQKTLPNPWNQLPTYWQQFTAEVKKGCAAEK